LANSSWGPQSKRKRRQNRKEEEDDDDDDDGDDDDGQKQKTTERKERQKERKKEKKNPNEENAYTHTHFDASKSVGNRSFVRSFARSCDCGCAPVRRPRIDLSSSQRIDRSIVEEELK
jgi:hypothetical protein